MKSRTPWLIFLLFCGFFCAGTLVLAQGKETPQQLKSQLELVKAGRDFAERLATEAIAALEEELSQVRSELAVCKKASVPEDVKP